MGSDPSEWNTGPAAEAEQSAARQAEFDAARQALEMQKTAWQAEAGERDRQDAAVQEETGRLRAELASAQAALADEQASGRPVNRRGQLPIGGRTAAAARQSELEAASQSFEQQKTAWRAEAAERERQNASAREEIEHLRAEIAPAQAALTEERRLYNAQRIEADNSQSAAAEQLAARQAELDAAVRAFDEQNAAWQTERTALSQRNETARASWPLASRAASAQTAVAEDAASGNRNGSTRTVFSRTPPNSLPLGKPSSKPRAGGLDQEKSGLGNAMCERPARFGRSPGGARRLAGRSPIATRRSGKAAQGMGGEVR